MIPYFHSEDVKLHLLLEGLFQSAISKFWSQPKHPSGFNVKTGKYIHGHAKDS